MAQLVMGDRPTGGRVGLSWGWGIFLILPIKMVHSGVLFVLLCTVNWLDVEGLQIELGANK